MAGGGRRVSFRESNVVDAEQGRPRARTPPLDDEVRIGFLLYFLRSGSTFHRRVRLRVLTLIAPRWCWP